MNRPKNIRAARPSRRVVEATSGLSMDTQRPVAVNLPTT
jgi:hypothetical protein